MAGGAAHTIARLIAARTAARPRPRARAPKSSERCSLFELYAAPSAVPATAYIASSASATYLPRSTSEHEMQARGDAAGAEAPLEPPSSTGSGLPSQQVLDDIRRRVLQPSERHGCPEPRRANRDAEVLAGSVSRLLSSLRTSLADSAECTREHLDVYAAARRARASGPALSVALTPAAATLCSRTRARACRQRAHLWSRQCGSPRRWRRWSNWRCRRALALARCVGMQPLTHSPQSPVESES